MSNKNKQEDNLATIRFLLRVLAYGAYIYSLYLLLTESSFEFNKDILAIVISIIGTGLLVNSNQIRG